MSDHDLFVHRDGPTPNVKVRFGKDIANVVVYFDLSY
jgi:hypothetical protein